MYKAFQIWLNLRGLCAADPKQRIAAVKALVSLQARNAVPALLPMLQDQDVHIRHTAAWALGELGDHGNAAELITLLEDRELEVRKAAIKALAQLGERQAVTPLIKLLGDGDSDIRNAAAKALAALGEPRWHEWVTGTDDDFVKLAQCGDRRAAPPLTKALEHSAWFVRKTAIEGLGRLGGKNFLGLFRKALQDKHPDVREAAAAALKKL